MLYGIIGDIHSNLEALSAVVERFKQQKPDKIICLGDIVGYGASPNECLNIIKDLTNISIAGNHDFGSCGLTDLKWFNPIAREACEWTARVLSPENLAYLKALPLKRNPKLSTLNPSADGQLSTLIVHSSPSNPEKWIYITSIEDAIGEFEFFDEDVCFIGHSHVPITFTKTDKGYGIIQHSAFRIHPSADGPGNSVEYIINVGSVGQPRDFDSRASYGLYDTGKGEIKIIRVEYDIKSTQTKILNAGLPPFLAYRLEEGR